MIIVRGL